MFFTYRRDSNRINLRCVKVSFSTCFVCEDNAHIFRKIIFLCNFRIYDNFFRNKATIVIIIKLKKKIMAIQNIFPHFFLHISTNCWLFKQHWLVILFIFYWQSAVILCHLTKPVVLFESDFGHMQIHTFTWFHDCGRKVAFWALKFTIEYITIV